MKKMSTLLKRSIGVASLVLMAGMLGACGNLSRKVAADGGSAGELAWPAPQSVNAMHKGGSFAKVANLRLIEAGMNKPQIMQLIGAPHFNEGVWNVREWNYLLNFRTSGSSEVTQCQYKVLFDEHKMARSFYWQPAACAGMLDEMKPEPSIAGKQVFTLLSDALFAFDKSDAAHIKSSGMDQLGLLAKKIATGDGAISGVRVVGYTDRLGSDDYNQKLSEKRADTVLGILQQKGVSASDMKAEGRGEANPVKTCETQGKVALIACLAPNRRVEITVEGSKH